MRSALTLLLLSAYVLLLPRSPWVGRAADADRAAARLVESATLDLGAAPPGADDAGATSVARGRRFVDVDVGAIAALVPSRALVAATALRLGRPGVGSRLLLATPSMLAALLSCLLFFSMALTLRASVGAALGCTLLLGLATSLALEARLPDGTAIATCLMLLGFECSRRGGARAALATGVTLGVMVLVDGRTWPAAAVLAVTSEPWWSSAGPAGRRSVTSRLVEGMLLIAVLAAATAGAVVYRRAIGWSLPSGGDLAQGLWGLLGSTGKSVVLYQPPLVLAAVAWPSFWRQERARARRAALVIAAHVLSIAATSGWAADPAWGPVSLLPVVPLALLPLAPWLDRVRSGAHRWLRPAAIAVAGAGLLVQLEGAAFAPAAYLELVTAVKNRSGAAGWFATGAEQAHFIPQLSPLVGHLWMLRSLVDRRHPLGYDPPWKLIVPQQVSLEDLRQRLQLDFWWLEVPGALAAGWVGLLVALGAVGGWAIVRGQRCRG